MPQKFNLTDIANWQLDQDNSNVTLPSIQRGFVWKPKQIEDLWDSILRGYPIGSFLLSKIGNKYDLMDGQQRATSIFIGYYNPFDINNKQFTWSLKSIPVLWIDLKPKNKSDTSKYSFKLTTSSHPWGYQAKDNSKKLSTNDRKKALEIFKSNIENNNGYTTFSNTTVFPFDSTFPVPFCFFLNSNNFAEIIKKIEDFMPEYIQTKEKKFLNKLEYLKLLNNDLKAEITEILEITKKRKILNINYDVIENETLNEEQLQDNPTLFIRINSSGTALTGDDLIYSIYKAIYPDAKKLVEEIDLNFIKPIQIISLASRIVASKLDNNAFIRKMNVQNFQTIIKNEDFRVGLNNILSTNTFKYLFNKAIEILSCKTNNLFKGEIPPILIKMFIKKNQELFLFLLYWLHINDKKDLSDQIKLMIASKLFIFSWFSFTNEKQLWLEKITNEKFWEEPLNEMMWWNNEDGIHFLLPPSYLRKYYNQKHIIDKFRLNNEHRWALDKKGVGKDIIEYYNILKNKEIENYICNEYFWKLIERLQHNRQLLLFAQREYINTEFTDFNNLEDLEDTDTPWDIDHIYPESWHKSKKFINQGIKDWNSTNGNYRALSLEQNRSENDTLSPCERLNSEYIRKISFVNENDFQYWSQITDRITDDTIDNHFQAITTRMINIYQKVWDDFKIKDLIKIQNQ